MSILDSLLVSVFGISVVFAVLIALSFLVKLQSVVLGKIATKSDNVPDAKGNADNDIIPQPVPVLSSGELKLIEVDEKTAAMIMAIVSDESHIPLSELQFKSIRLLEK